eukprot:1161553-Pelagomonas_calceolata.AAC.8
MMGRVHDFHGSCLHPDSANACLINGSDDGALSWLSPAGQQAPTIQGTALGMAIALPREHPSFILSSFAWGFQCTCLSQALPSLSAVSPF